MSMAIVLRNRSVLDEDALHTSGPAGALGVSRFVVGVAAADASDRIIYDAATGALYWDADGTGAAAQVKFAQLTIGLALTAADFVVV